MLDFIRNNRKIVIDGPSRENNIVIYPNGLVIEHDRMLAESEIEYI